MDHLRKILDKYIDTTYLTDVEVVQIIEDEAMKKESFITLDNLIKG